MDWFGFSANLNLAFVKINFEYHHAGSNLAMKCTKKMSDFKQLWS
jgi:hypothetical protein